MIRHPSLQARRLGVEGIEDDVLFLGRGEYRAALEVGGLCFSLLSEVQQEAVLESYARWLNGLTSPIQLLVRVLPLDLAGYLADLDPLAEESTQPELAALTRDHMTFLHGLARERHLLERHLYAIVAVGGDGAPARWPFGRRRRELSLMEARQQISARCDEVIDGLRRCRLSARRLTGQELGTLLYTCWCPERSRQQRLHPALAARPIVAVRGRRTTERSA